MPGQILFLYRRPIFSTWHTTALLPQELYAWGPSETLKSPIKMQKKKKKCGAKQTAKRILVYSMRAETKM